MEHQEHHEMQIAQTHASGAEEWYCPTCGRRFLMNWPPAYSKIVLEPGDEYAMHSGGKGDLTMGVPAISTPDQALETDPLLREIESDIREQDEALRPWLKWLQTANLDDLANQG